MIKIRNILKNVIKHVNFVQKNLRIVLKNLKIAKSVKKDI